MHCAATTCMGNGNRQALIPHYAHSLPSFPRKRESRPTITNALFDSGSPLSWGRADRLLLLAPRQLAPARLPERLSQSRAGAFQRLQLMPHGVRLGDHLVDGVA